MPGDRPRLHHLPRRGLLSVSQSREDAGRGPREPRRRKLHLVFEARSFRIARCAQWRAASPRSAGPWRPADLADALEAGTARGTAVAPSDGLYLTGVT